MDYGMMNLHVFFPKLHIFHKEFNSAQYFVFWKYWNEEVFCQYRRNLQTVLHFQGDL